MTTPLNQISGMNDQKPNTVAQFSPSSHNLMGKPRYKILCASFPHAGQLIETPFGACGEIRTHTLHGLNMLPLPVGLRRL
jgi:hypothetical protein